MKRKKTIRKKKGIALLNEKLKDFDSIINLLSILFAVIAITISYSAYKMSILKPKFNFKYVSYDEFTGYQMYKELKDKKVGSINLHVFEVTEEIDPLIKYSEGKVYEVGITRPECEIHFILENIGEVASEDTKVFFEFKEMSIESSIKKDNINYDEIEWDNFKRRPSWYMYIEKLYWKDTEKIMYPNIQKEFIYIFSKARIYGENPYIDVSVVSKNSVTQKYKIYVNVIKDAVYVPTHNRKS